jgi:hypothetical protein
MIGLVQARRASVFQAANPNTAAPQVAAELPGNTGPKSQAAQFVDQLRQLAGKGADPTRIPFKLVCEVKGDQSRMSRVLAGTGWDVGALKGNNHNSGGDCSHSNDGGGSSYVRLLSPELTLGGGGLDSIADVLERLRAQNVAIGSTAALRFMVPTSALNDEATANFIGLHLSNEDLLYRLGQNGGAGRDLTHKSSFASPPSAAVNYTAGMTAAQWQACMNRRNCGLNSYTQGWWEMRYFDSSLDTAAVQASACMVVGMAAAAIDGRAGFAEKRTTSQFYQEVDHGRWSAFTKAVVGQGPLSDQLRTQFTRSGGRIAEPLDGAAQAAAQRLLARGWQIFGADGSPARSHDDLLHAFSGPDKAKLVPPSGRKIDVDADDFRNFLVGENELQGTVPASLHEAHGQAHHLSWRASLKDAQGLPMSALEAAFEVSQGRSFVAQNGSFSVKISQQPAAGDGLSLAQAVAIPDSDWAAMGTQAPRLDAPLDSPAAAAHWLQMRRGFQFTTDGTPRFGAVAGAAARVIAPNVGQLSLSPEDLLTVGRFDRGGEDAPYSEVRQALERLQPLGVSPRPYLPILQMPSAERLSHGELLAALLGHSRACLMDPLGSTHPMSDVPQFLQTAERLQEESRLEPAWQQSTQAFEAGLGSRFAATWGIAPLHDVKQLPFAMARRMEIQMIEPGVTDRPTLGVKADNWNRLGEILDIENPERTPADLAPMLAQADGLREKGVTFYYVSADPKVKLELRSAMAERLPGEGVKAKLPRFKLWHGWPRRNITLHGEKQMHKLARKFGVA